MQAALFIRKYGTAILQQVADILSCESREILSMNLKNTSLYAT